MAVAPTGAIYKALKFDGVSSRTYGVYITGEAVYNAPERDVEMIPIPGRNGSFALDNGRFENIEVTYPAGIFAETEADFAAAISDFRNYLCSRKGYCRLTDEYNPDEYRLAIYKSGLEVDPAFLKAGEFTITFECKPQRYLTSGETAISVTSGDTITNPTHFESEPLLEVFGDGNIIINESIIEVHDATLDDQILNNGYKTTSPFPVEAQITLDQNLNAMSNGDAFTIDGITITETYSVTVNDPTTYEFHHVELRIPIPTGVIELSGSMVANNTYKYEWKYPAISFIYGTASSSTSIVVQMAYYFKNINTGTISADGPFPSYTFYVDYDGDKTITVYINGTTPYTNNKATADILRIIKIPKVIGTPSLSNLTKYIDCEIGECYAYQGGELITWNNAAVLPADLPKLKSGSNSITYDNTISSFKIAPRWWKV